MNRKPFTYIFLGSIFIILFIVFSYSLTIMEFEILPLELLQELDDPTPEWVFMTYVLLVLGGVIAVCIGIYYLTRTPSIEPKIPQIRFDFDKL